MKKIFKVIIMMLFCMIVTSCSQLTNTNSEVNLICNDTSAGFMAETEKGFFALRGNILYYSDKSDLTTWVPVCNKPDCKHTDDTMTCNAYMPSAITQKGEKLYGIVNGNAYEGTYIFEVKTDGTGKEIVYSFPEDDGIEITSWACHAFHEQMVWYYAYVDEAGMWQKRVLALRENEEGKLVQQTLYEKTLEDFDSGYFPNANRYWTIRGDDVVLSTFLIDEEKEEATNNNTLTRIGETSLERIILPEEADLLGAYLSGDTYIYYEINEGFYRIDIPTGERTLLFENKLQDAWGYVFNEDYMIECNRYTDSKPENPCLRFYHNNQWKEIELPEAVKESDDAFYPIALASDRIFYQHGVKKNVVSETGVVEWIETIDWYYFKTNEENPEFVYIGEIPSVEREEGNSPTEETEETTEEDGFEDIVVFDNEDFFLKIVNAYIKNGEYCIDIYYENRSQNDKYNISLQECNINGMNCKVYWGMQPIEPGKISNKILTIPVGEYAEKYNISQFYDAEDYTKIELFFLIKNRTQGENYQEKIVTLYPKGEENVTLFTREPLDTDIVLVDNEYIRVVLTGYDTGCVKNDTLKVYMLNKTDKNIRLYVEEASVNNQFILKLPYTLEEKKEIEESENAMCANWTLFDFTLTANSCSIYKLALFDFDTYDDVIDDKFFKQNQITSIEEIAIHLKMHSCEGHIYDDGDYSFDETIVVKP